MSISLWQGKTDGETSEGQRKKKEEDVVAVPLTLLLYTRNYVADDRHEEYR
jgi:hypothetical protein